MAPNVVLNLFPPKQLKSVGEAIGSVTDTSVFPPKPTDSVIKAIKSVAERLVLSPVKLTKQLVFTEFGLSPLIRTPSSDFLLLPAKPNTPHLSPSSPFPPLKAETPRSDPKDHKRCRCKQSRCLKLYCECFAAGAYCDGCHCNGCRNNVENEALRQEAAKSILERNPYAFSPKIASSQYSAQDSEEDMKNVAIVGKHNKGCRCKKTRCLQKYCECFHAEVFCSENCKCVECRNFEGSAQRIALSGREWNNTKISENFAAGMDNSMRKIRVQQANAAIYNALGLSGHSLSRESLKRKFQEFLDSDDTHPPIQRLADDQSISHLLHPDSNIQKLADDQKVSNILHPDSNVQRLADDQKENPVRVAVHSSASSADPADHIYSATALSSSKFRSRSLLADVIHSQDIEDLCSFLVLASEDAKIVPDRNGTLDIQDVRENQNSSIQVKENVQEDVQKEVPDGCLSGNQADGVNTYNFVSGGIKVKEGRHSYLRTIAQMCNEKDKTFTGPNKPCKIPNHGCNTDVYIKQERLVMASFRDSLRKVITLGNMKASHQLKSSAGQCQHVNHPLKKMEPQHE